MAFTSLTEEQFNKLDKVHQEKYLDLKKRYIITLKQVKQYRDDNKLEFFDKKPNPGPNPRQAELFNAFLDDKYSVFTYLGGNRAGKTTAGVIIAISSLTGNFMWSNQRLVFPHNKARKIRIIGQDWEKHIKTVIIPELYKWWPKKRPLTVKKNTIGVESLWTDEMTGGTIEIMSNSQESDLHEGWHGDLIYYDEPPRREIRVANARGLVDRRGRELFCMTLLKEPWIDKEVVKATLSDGRPDPTVFNVICSIYDNIGFGITEEGVNQFAKTLTDEEKATRLEGKPSYMSGLVYPEFDRKIHIKPRFDIPLDWIVDIAIDIHPRKEQAILFMATAPNGNKYLVREIWNHGDGTWVGEEIVKIINRNSYRIGRIIIDPLAKGDGNNENTVFDKVNIVLMRYGYILETACKDKDSGIIEVRKHLKGPNNEPSVFMFPDLIRTIKEIEGLVWDKETQKASKVDDDMMENFYRLCLLDTKWFDADDNEEYYGNNESGRDACTGY